MRKLILSVFPSLLVLSALCLLPLKAQERKGSITGQVTDVSHGVLHGARVETEPKGPPTTTDSQGDFTISDLDPGTYHIR